ncbi:MAG: hypothetical protein ABJC39_11635 [Chloroflexota bacterium]
MQIVNKLTGLTQNASQTAQIVQTATGGPGPSANSNTTCVLQKTTIDGSTQVGKNGMPITVTLDAHQSISIKQDSLNGDNAVKNANAVTGACDTSALTQSQSLTSKASGPASITQKENAAASGPNLLLDIEQNQSSGFLGIANGQNTSAFSQTSTQAASAGTVAGPVSQTQSTAPGGGLQANVNQFSHGLSTSTATQTESQCEHATPTNATPATCDASTHAQIPPGYTLSQAQYGPVRCCSNQADNSGDMFTVTQTSTQSNDSGANQTNDVQADCTTSGTCTATQTTTVNGTTTTNAQTGSDVHTQTTCSGSDCTTTGGNPNFIPRTDVAEFGYGGMRGVGTGSIDIGAVNPATVTKALLYWNGPTNSTNPSANAAVSFADTSITGTNIGFASSNCWESAGFTNSQSYSADVTSLVKAGTGTYNLSNFHKPPGVEINGVALIVFYNDGDPSNDRNVVLWSGNDSNVGVFDPNTNSWPVDGWDETLTGVPYPGSGSASLDFVVSDGQTFDDDALVVNGTTLVAGPAIFQGETLGGTFSASGSLWDVKPFPIPSGVLSPGSNNLHLTTGEISDCLSLVVAMANVPASSGPIILSPAVALRQQAQAARVQSAPDRSAQSGSARPSAQGSGGLARTASLPLRPGRSG